jgi:GNAT superfamily N-acetyltransferase
VATVDGKDVAVMSIENLDGDFGATCWVGGCWTDPNHRGLGALRAMFTYLDQQADIRDWSKQGLGVWIDNYSAITAYEKLGFVAMGEPQESTRKPGKFYQRMIRG